MAENKNFYTSVDLNLNELLNALVQSLAAAPDAGERPAARIWYNATTQRLQLAIGGDVVKSVAFTDDALGGGVSTVTVSAPLVDNGTATDPDLSLPNATTAAAGAMSAADKTKLDGVDAGATANASDAQLRDRTTHTGTQPASSISDLPESVQDIVGAMIATGAGITATYDDVAGTITLALTSAVLGAVKYQGAWNAATNTPELASGVGTQGDYYVVSTDGATDLDGITDWVDGDMAIFNGAVWEKIDNTDRVASVAGRTGAVTLTVSDIAGALAAASNLSDVDDVATARTNLGLKGQATRHVYRQNIGNGALTSFTITQATHGCGASPHNRVTVIANATGTEVYPGISQNAGGDVTVAFTGKVPAANEFSVVVEES